VGSLRSSSSTDQYDFWMVLRLDVPVSTCSTDWVEKIPEMRSTPAPLPG
jgi:hypothetical protein